MMKKEQHKLKKAGGDPVFIVWKRFRSRRWRLRTVGGQTRICDSDAAKKACRSKAGDMHRRSRCEW